MYPAYQPSNLGMTILALVFYILMAGFVIYSMLGLYALLRFGRSMILGMIVTLMYLIISASLYTAAVANLSNIHF